MVLFFRKEQNLLFLKKKKQKDFYFWCCIEMRDRLATGRVTVILTVMDTANADTTARRLEIEADCIAEARADVAAGRLVDAVKVRAWVNSLRSENPLAVPYSGR